MKKLTSIFLSVILLAVAFVFPKQEVFYASPALSMSVSSSSVNIGDTVTATVTVPGGYGAQVDIRFPAGVLSYSEASTSNVNTSNVANGQVTLNMYEALGTSTVTVKFKAASSGTAAIEAVVVKAGDENGDEVQMSGASKSVTVANQAVQDPAKSNDNSLATLKLSSGTLSPAFKYNVTEYTATVDYNVTRIDITAQTSNAKAVIESMTGNENLKVGENLITIVVKAESGEKAAYKIVVTRKAQETGGEEPGNDPSESESTSDNNTETEIEGVDSGLTWNGTPLLFTETIPAEMIPADFSQETMMLDNKEIPCLTYNKGNLTVLCLKTAESDGALYLFDREEENVYPFIKLQSNDRYIIILQPDEFSAPEGYEMCSLSIEGKGVVTACAYKEDGLLSDFYLLYCINNDGDDGWYQYDSVEKTFQRFSGNVSGEGSTVTGGDVSEEDLNSNSELEASLKEEQNKNRMMLCVFVFVVAVLLVVIFNLILTRRKNEEDDELEEDEFDDEVLEDDYSESEEKSDNDLQQENSKSPEDETVIPMTDVVAETEEMESYEASEELSIEETQEEKTEETESFDMSDKLTEEIVRQKASFEGNDDEEQDDDLEFIDL